MAQNTDPASPGMSEQVLRWFNGPVRRYIEQENAIINSILLTTPVALVVLGWEGSAREQVVGRMQSGIIAVSRGERKVDPQHNISSFTVMFKDKPGSLILPA